MLEPRNNAQLPAIPGKRYFTIGEVSELCGVKPHVLRYWEQEFPQLKPVKRRGNRRYYQRQDVIVIRQIRSLLYEQGFTIGGARNKLGGEEARTDVTQSQQIVQAAAGRARGANENPAALSNRLHARQPVVFLARPALWRSARWLGLAAPVQGAELSSSAQQHIRAATFEVVQLKPPEGVVTYDHALPLDLLPYQQRTDKYRSIGTAFAIGPNRYVTAAHVIDLGIGSQYGPPALRDGAGKVYDIDQVLKFSDTRDFVVFSLREPPQDAKSLATGRKPALNSQRLRGGQRARGGRDHPRWRLYLGYAGGARRTVAVAALLGCGLTRQ